MRGIGEGVWGFGKVFVGVERGAKVSIGVRRGGGGASSINHLRGALFSRGDVRLNLAVVDAF